MPPPPGARGKKAKNAVKLPAHLLAKVKKAGYDPEEDTSLTDDDIALLAKWKNAQGGNKKKAKKKPIPGVAEDLLSMPPPAMKKEDWLKNPKDNGFDMKRLMLPNGIIPVGTPNFCTFYSPAMLDGFVNQHSPACAAAATAGAWNALMNWHRHHDSALGQDNVVAVMKSSLEDKIETRKQAVAGRLSIAGDEQMKVVDYFIEKMRQSMLDDKMEPFIWEKGEQKKDLYPRIKKIAHTGFAPDSEEEVWFRQFREWCDEEEVHRNLMRKKKKKAEALKEGKAVVDEEHHEEANEEVTEEPSGNASAMNQVYALIDHLSGYAKITAERPSTSFFGNDGIFQSIQRLSQHTRTIDMIATPYMGKQKGNAKDSADIIVRDKDSPQTIADQWAQFREEFMAYNSAFLFHQINHYSLIYAMREWQDHAGNKHRQILTAKRGQRPTAWLTFKEVRKILVSWHGYKIIRICRLLPKLFTGDWRVGCQMSVVKGPPRVPTPPSQEVTWSMDEMIRNNRMTKQMAMPDTKEKQGARRMAAFVADLQGGTVYDASTASLTAGDPSAQPRTRDARAGTQAPPTPRRRSKVRGGNHGSSGRSGGAKDTASISFSVASTDNQLGVPGGHGGGSGKDRKSVSQHSPRKPAKSATAKGSPLAGPGKKGSAKGSAKGKKGAGSKPAGKDKQPAGKDKPRKKSKPKPDKPPGPPELPAHLKKKLDTPGYDPDNDTSLTDDDIALLAAHMG